MSKIKDWYKEHEVEVKAGTIGGLIGVVCCGIGYECGKRNAIFVSQAAVNKDPERYIKLVQIGISKYKGKHLEKLEKAGESVVKVFEEFGV